MSSDLLSGDAQMFLAVIAINCLIWKLARRRTENASSLGSFFYNLVEEQEVMLTIEHTELQGCRPRCRWWYRSASVTSPQAQPAR
jgi:hypothetical protein